ncbi:3-oxoacyl-reductase [Panus rudis PR-1116 ss-1]|nr:3-oxoacyl-reductase [Panus rudis PR-1116 ss-1]
MTQTVFITGTSSGIGLASAKLFFGKGWNVVATMRAPEKDTELKQLDPACMLVQRLDVQDQSTIESAIQAALNKFGKIDLLINNAGYGQFGVFELLPPEKVKEQFDVNVFGVMNVTRAVLPHFRAQKSGGIINISSGAGIFGLPIMSLYNASKFALEGFTESLAYELAPLNIFVKSVIPHGGVSSTNFGRRNPFSPDELAKAPEYGPFVQKTMEHYRKLIGGIQVSSAEVAKAIYDAATDGTEKLRYFIGQDNRGFLKARYQTTSDDEYIAHMRSYYRSS